jgi:hypothetical protein
VKVPVVQPCLKKEDVPVDPTPTKVDPAKASTNQLAAAAAADVMALEQYARKMDALLQACLH